MCNNLLLMAMTHERFCRSYNRSAKKYFHQRSVTKESLFLRNWDFKSREKIVHFSSFHKLYFVSWVG